MRKSIVLEKAFKFAIKIIRLYRYLCIEKKEYVLSKQLLRSGTSIGANIKEGVNAYTKTEFKYKLSIALKEANESEYWIELLIASDILRVEECKLVLEECRELCKMLSSIIKTCNKSN